MKIFQVAVQQITTDHDPFGSLSIDRHASGQLIDVVDKVDLPPFRAHHSINIL